VTRGRSQRGFTLVEMMVVVAIIGILAGFVFSVSSRPVGASARTASEQIVSMIDFAKLRAASTRRIHRVQVEPRRVSIWVLSVTGLVIPAGPPPTWTLVQTLTIPRGVAIWDATAGATATTGGSATENTSLVYDLDVRPDGQATATTLWVTDGRHNFRVLTYGITGSTRAREFW
jgi:prepilin-type N-terminal cleavage/methylation domain-containing protein